jgi:hypothetical protein
MWSEGGDVLTDLGRRKVEAAFVVLPTTALIGVMVGGAPVAWRFAVAAVFFLVSPGLAVLAPARFRLELELAMILPTSLATTSLVSLALFYGGVWTPALTVACLAALCALGVAVAAARDLRAATATSVTTVLSGETEHGWGEAT